MDACCHHLLYRAASQNQMPPDSWVGFMEFEKEPSAKSLSNSITKQNQTKPRQSKTKITGQAKQNICRPDLVHSLQTSELG